MQHRSRHKLLTSWWRLACRVFFHLVPNRCEYHLLPFLPRSLHIGGKRRSREAGKGPSVFWEKGICQQFPTLQNIFLLFLGGGGGFAKNHVCLRFFFKFVEIHTWSSNYRHPPREINSATAFFFKKKPTFLSTLIDRARKIAPNCTLLFPPTTNSFPYSLRQKCLVLSRSNRFRETRSLLGKKVVVLV